MDIQTFGYAHTLGQMIRSTTSIIAVAGHTMEALTSARTKVTRPLMMIRDIISPSKKPAAKLSRRCLLLTAIAAASLARPAGNKE
jgi:hypothetical protein